MEVYELILIALVMDIAGYFLALLIGITLGLIGGGGSILTVPLLVYVFGIPGTQATGYSLLVVGSTAFVGALTYIKRKEIAFKEGVLFSLPAFLSVYLTRKIVIPSIPESVANLAGFELTRDGLLLIIFAVVMLAASFSMIKSKKVVASDTKKNIAVVMLIGFGVGIMTGLVGAGGGFLIIPALVLFLRLDMKVAVGTSLMIIAANSLVGFLGTIGSASIPIPWNLLLALTAISIVGILIGTVLAKKIPGSKLKVGFGYFVLVMGLFILAQEVLFKQ